MEIRTEEWICSPQPVRFEPKKRKLMDAVLKWRDLIQKKMENNLPLEPEYLDITGMEGMGLVGAGIRVYVYLRLQLFQLMSYKQAVEELFQPKVKGDWILEWQYWDKANGELEKMQHRLVQKQLIKEHLGTAGQEFSPRFLDVEWEVAGDLAVLLMTNRQAVGVETSHWEQFNAVMNLDQTLVKREHMEWRVAEDVATGGSLLIRGLGLFLGKEPKPRRRGGGREWVQFSLWMDFLKRQHYPLSERTESPKWFHLIELAVQNKQNREAMLEDDHNPDAYIQFVRAEGERVVFNNENSLFTTEALTLMLNAKGNLARHRKGRKKNKELEKLYKRLEQDLQELWILEKTIENSGGEKATEQEIPPMLRIEPEIGKELNMEGDVAWSTLDGFAMDEGPWGQEWGTLESGLSIPMGMGMMNEVNEKDKAQQQG